MSKLKKLALGISLITSACSSNGPKVLERADGMSSRPDWVTETKSTYKEDSNMYFIGFVTLEGDSSPSAAYNGSDEKALSEPMKSLVDSFIDQNGLGEDLKDSTGQRILSSLRKSRVPMPGLQITRRYYERVQLSAAEGDGPGRVVLKVFSLAEVPVTEYNTAKKLAYEKIRGVPEIKTALKDVQKKQMDQVFEKDASRAPASGE